MRVKIYKKPKNDEDKKEKYHLSKKTYKINGKYNDIAREL